jgi:hypothetical protein
MTFLEIFAFVILPIVVVAGGALAVWLNDRDLRSRHTHPGE